MAQVKCLILATTSSSTFEEQLHQRGSDINGLSAHSTDRVTLPLLPVGGVTVLDKWLKAVCTCPHLQPIQDHVYVLTSSDNYSNLCDWAASTKLPSGMAFPVSNILCTGSAGEPSHSVAGLARFLEASNLQDHLVVIDSSYCFEPDFNLRRIVQTAVVRGKDTICYTDTAQRGVSSPQSSQLAVCLAEDTCNPRVSGFEQLSPADAAAASNAAMPCAAPLFVFHRDTLPDIAQCSCSTSSELLQQLVQSRPVYGLPVGCCLSVESLEEYLLTDAFFKQLHVQNSGGSAAMLSKTAVSITAKASALPSTAALPASTIRNSLMDFGSIYEVLQAEAAAKQTLSKIRAIPPQFADVKVWKHKPRKQHPVYATSNNTYGYKQPTQQEMPMSWNGIRGEFTKNFVVGNGHTGFATGITGSKVHRALDDL